MRKVIIYTASLLAIYLSVLQLHKLAVKSITPIEHLGTISQIIKHYRPNILIASSIEITEGLRFQHDGKKAELVGWYK
jgi:hypothetical protein